MDNGINNKRKYVKEAPPTPGYEWICKTCEESCKVIYQDVSPDERRMWEYRSNCCSGYYTESVIEEGK